MKVTFLRLLFLFCLLTSSSVVCHADGDGPTIPVLTIPDNNSNTDDPHRSPALYDVYAVFDTTTSTLDLVVSSGIEISSIEIYKDGVLIITDTVPTLSYALSGFGNGTYTIILTTNNGISYTGNFTY